MISYVYNPFSGNMDTISTPTPYSAKNGAADVYPGDTLVVTHPPVQNMGLLPLVFKFVASIGRTKVAFTMDWPEEYEQEIPGDITLLLGKMNLRNDAPPATIFRKDARDLPTINDVKTGTDAATGWIYVDDNEVATSSQTTATGLKTTNTTDAIVFDLPDDIFTFPYDYTVNSMVKSGEVDVYIDDTVLGKITSVGDEISFNGVVQTAIMPITSATAAANAVVTQSNDNVGNNAYFFTKDEEMYVMHVIYDPSTYLNKLVIHKILSNGLSCSLFYSTIHFFNLTATISNDNKLMFRSVTNGKYTYSVNMIDFTEYTNPGTISIPLLYSTNCLFFCFNSNSSAVGYYSLNGIDWITITFPASVTIYGVKYFNGKYYFITKTTIVRVTTNLATFTSITFPATCMKIYTVGNALIFISSTGLFYYMLEGDTTYRTPTNQKAHPVIYYRGYYFSYETYATTKLDNCIYYTKDFITWGILFYDALEDKARYFLQVGDDLYLYMLDTTTNVTTRVKINIKAGVPSLNVPISLVDKTIKASELTTAVTDIVFKDNIGFYFTSFTITDGAILAKRSTDYGATWETVNVLQTSEIISSTVKKLYYDPDIDKIVLFLILGKVYTTTDCLSWTHELSFATPAGITSVQAVGDYYIANAYYSAIYYVDVLNKKTGICMRLLSGSSASNQIIGASKLLDKYFIYRNTSTLYIYKDITQLQAMGLTTPTMSVSIEKQSASNSKACIFLSNSSNACIFVNEKSIIPKTKVFKTGVFLRAVVVINDIFITLSSIVGPSYLSASHDGESWIDVAEITTPTALTGLCHSGEYLYVYNTTDIVQFRVSQILQKFNELSKDSVIKLKATKETIVSTIGVNVEVADMLIVPAYTGQSGDYLVQSPNYVTPRYFITDTWDVLLHKALSITGITITAETPSGSTIKALMSIDDGVSWCKPGSDAISLDIVIGSDLRSLLNLNSVDISSFGPVLQNLTLSDQKIKFAIDLQTADTTVTPNISDISFQFIQSGLYQQVQTGEGTEWNVYNITEDKTCFEYKGTQKATVFAHVLPLG